MGITAEQKYILNRHMGAAARKVGLGDLLDAAEETTVTPAASAAYRGTFTTLGGDATESIPVVGVTAADIVQVNVKTAGGTPRSVVAAAAGTDAISVTLSGDPSTDHVLQYIVFRNA